MMVEGTERHYALFRPDNSSSEAKLPLVILLHGAFSNPASVAFNSAMKAFAKKDKFILVTPAGTPVAHSPLRFWNAGECCGPASHRHIDDVGFIAKIIERFKSEKNVDPARINIAGVSNGGMLAYRLAAECSEQIAAIGSVDGWSRLHERDARFFLGASEKRYARCQLKSELTA